MPVSLPGHQRTIDPKQRRRVLEQHIEAREGPRGDHVAFPAATLPGFRPAAHDLDVLELEVLRRLLQEDRLLAHTLDEHDPRFRARDGQNQPWKARA